MTLHWPWTTYGRGTESAARIAALEAAFPSRLHATTQAVAIDALQADVITLRNQVDFLLSQAPKWSPDWSPLGPTDTRRNR